MASRSVAGGGRGTTRQATVVRGKKATRIQREKPGAFIKKRRAEFLAVLAETCNVSMACRDAKVAPSTVYERRKTDAAFRIAWGEAVGLAYRKLELVLLERSLTGSEKLIIRKDGGEERIREYPNAIALQLLKMHRDTVVESEREFSDEEADEIRERLIAKLKRLKEREEQGPAK